VHACADAQPAGNNSWVAHNSNPGSGQFETGDGCGDDGAYAGLYARDNLCAASCPPIPSNAAAGWTFTAPPGTTITALAYSRWFYKDADDAVGVEGGERRQIPLNNASTLHVGVRCKPNASGNCIEGATLHEVAAVLYGATVTLSDASVPTVTNLSGSLLAGGYVDGERVVRFDASDNVGIRAARLYVDGVVAGSATYGCDFTFAVPCWDKSDGGLTLDTGSLADGTHTVEVAAVDPAGNEGKASRQTIAVDNDAPARPQGLTVDGGDGWRATNSFSVEWTNPANAGAPISIAHYQVCTSDGSSCAPEQQAAAIDISRINGISVPARGEWILRVWLEDAAGHANRNDVSWTTLRYGSSSVTRDATTEAAAPPSLGPTGVPLTNEATLLPVSTTTQTLSARRDPSLRLAGARLHGSRIYVLGRIARGVEGRLALTLRLNGRRILRQTITVRGGRFTIRLRMPRIRSLNGLAIARFSGDGSFRPARATLRLGR
jgi:hypothetical protein